MPKVTVEYEQAQRERILEGAAQSFADGGYRQTSIDEIARNLGISKGAIYIYFKSKEELFTAIFSQTIKRDALGLQTCIAVTQGVLVKLEMLLDSYLASLFDNNPIRARLLPEFWLESPRLPELQKLFLENKRQEQALLATVLEEAMKEGLVRPDVNIQEVTEVILATCEGLILSNVTGSSLLNREEVKRAVWNTFAAVLLQPLPI